MTKFQLITTATIVVLCTPFLMPSNRKRVQAYVSLSTHAMLSDYASKEGISVSEAASQILQTYLVSDESPRIGNKTASNYVTKQELSSVINQIEKLVTREIAIAETRWQSHSERLMAYQNSAIRVLADPKNAKLSDLDMS